MHCLFLDLCGGLSDFKWPFKAQMLVVPNRRSNFWTPTLLQDNITKVPIHLTISHITVDSIIVVVFNVVLVG